MSQLTNPKISVIIPAYNEQDCVQECINSLFEQTFKPLEIIVVDDGSQDKTLHILKKFKGIKVLRQPHLGPGSARNKGAKKAKGEILVFVDADMTFDKRFIDRLTLPIREKGVIGTFSRQEHVQNLESRWARNWSIDHGWLEGRMHPQDYPDEQPVFRAIQKDKFDQAGGFDEWIGYTDDWSLSRKLGIKAKNSPSAKFYHKNPDSLKQVFIQAKWTAKRPYKFGILGRTLALLRVSAPISLFTGIHKAIRYRSASFIIYKLVADSGRFIGISSLFLGGSRAK